MTRRATFGDFATSAEHHLRRLQWTWPTGGDRAAAGDVVADLSRAVHALACYADDAVRVLDADQLARDRQLGIWVRAATQTREALVTAEAALPAAPGPEGDVSNGRPGRGSGDLRGATRSMTLGRDLLHTHDAFATGRLAAGGSEWTPVVSSAPVTCAVLREAGGWTRQIAGHAYRMCSAAGCPEAERRILSAAGKTLSQVSWAVGAAQERRPVRQGQLRLLHAIPVNTIPEACLPAGGDSAADLAAGVISTAERLRIAAKQVPAEAPWSRQLTRETLRQTAGCCAINASSLQITLAAQRGTPGRPATASLAEAADAVDRARHAWLAVTESWNWITTDTRGAVGPAGIEAAALALWTGRLAYANPDWTPNLGPHHQPRQAGELATDTDQLRGSLDAAHHVAHTLAKVAETDRDQVRAAAMAGRLIVPTRSLPDEYDVPYRFAPAPPSSSDPLQSSYNRALRASEEATAAMAQVAAEMQADSRVLTTARAATRGDPSAWAGQPLHELSADLGRTQRRESPGATRHPQLAPPGPVERALLSLEVTSKPDLEQAAAIDKAADRLILRAAATAPPLQRRELRRSPGAAELDRRVLVTDGGVAALRQRPGRQAEFEAGA